MDNDARMRTWCRMWSEDPELAHQLLADDGRQWSGQTAALDAVVGPAQQVAFVTAYRAQHVNVFTPRLLVDAGERFGYLWDVARPDGSTVTGLDVNVLAGDRIVQNWTFAAARPCELPDPAERPDDAPLDADGLAAAVRRWVTVWDGHAGAADGLVTADFLAWSGATGEAASRGPAALRGLETSERASRSTGTVRLHREPALDVARQRVVLLWTALEQSDAGTDEVGGVDLLQLREGKVARSWSLRGTRGFRY